MTTPPPAATPGSLASRALLGMIGFYRNGISPFTPPSCRFHPTCSEYAQEAIRVHGAGRGTWLATVRLLKCAPWHPGGFDPVPEGHAPEPHVPELHAPEPPVPGPRRPGRH